MKYLYKPKKISVCFFCFFIVLAVALNVYFFCQTDNTLFNADLYVSILICYDILIAFVFSYILCCIEKLCGFTKMQIQFIVFRILRIVDIVAGVLLCIVWYFFYENNMITNTASLSVLYVCQVLAISVLLLTIAVLLFVSAARKGKKCKVLKQEDLKAQHMEELKNKVNDSLGFEYETSEYFKQTHISYAMLQAQDGTQGEFEAYRQLVNADLKGISFVFNREIPKKDGLFTEIDMILLHKNGVVVLENKQYSTVIYGRATDHDWTIINHSGHKKSIYNPIKQNENHVNALREYLLSKNLYTNEDKIPIYSVVAFTDLDSNRSDNMISRIEDVDKTHTVVCTSQNLCFTVQNLLGNDEYDFSAEMGKIKQELLSLSVRKKY